MKIARHLREDIVVTAAARRFPPNDPRCETMLLYLVQLRKLEA